MEGPGKHVIANGQLAQFRTKANNGPGERLERDPDARVHPSARRADVQRP
jgi:hypothetical protein